MAQFIRLKIRKGQNDLLLNVERISSIRDIQSDPAVKDNPDWRFTVVHCDGVRYEVRETEAEILEKIGINV